MSLAEQIAKAFDPDFKRSKNEFLCRCPNTSAHSNGDKKKSFSIKDNSAKPFGVEFNCFVCGPGPLVQLIVDTGLIKRRTDGKAPAKKEKKESAAEEQARLNREKQKAKAEKERKKKEAEKALKAEEVGPPGSEYLFATYPYDDERGEPFVRVLRYNVENSKDKRFLPQRFVNGAWINGLGEPPVTVPLQYVGDVRKAASKGEKVFVVEGEKLVELLRKFGKVATTNITGANRQWEHIWTLTVLGAEVIVIADNNAVGRRHSVDICKAIFEAGGKCKLIELPGLTDPKDDLEQWLDLHSVAELDHLVKKTEFFSFSELEPEEVEVVFETFCNTDLANAERIAKRFGRDLKWTEEKGWFGYDGKRYRANPTLAIKVAKKSAKLIYREADLVHGKEREWLREWAKSSESASKIKAAVELTKDEVLFSFLDFDPDPYLLNCQNGIISLLDRKIIKHHRKFLCSRVMPVSYDPKATCPTWDRFLKDITGDDKDMIEFLYRCIGYSLSGLTVEECVFFLWGHGRNGKSKLVETIVKMLGDYAAGLPTESLMDVQGREGARHDLAALVGARMVSASETQEGQRLNEALLKRMSGGDSMRVRNLYHDFFDMSPVWKLWLTGNYKPSIKGQDPAIWERLILIPFDVYIAPERRDPFLMQKLLGELPGILNKCLDGFEDYYHGVKDSNHKTIRGLRRPDRVVNASLSYQQDQDTIGAWLEECAVLQPYAYESGKNLYQSYVKHCKARDVFNKSDKSFYENLESRPGVEAKRDHRGKVFKGIGLRAESGFGSEGAA